MLYVQFKNKVSDNLTIYIKKTIKTMKNLKSKIQNLLNLDASEMEEEILSNNRDGLFERKELINKKLVTKDGRQLLKETRFN